jgi:hypothetical protein
MNWIARIATFLVLWAGLAHAQGFGPPFAVQGASFAVEQRADPYGYYVLVHSAGLAPQDLQVSPGLAGFRVDARQSSGAGAAGFGAFSVSQFSQWVALPPDADLARAQRRDEPGRILIVVPRRAAGLW